MPDVFRFARRRPTDIAIRVSQRGTALVSPVALAVACVGLLVACGGTVENDGHQGTGGSGASGGSGGNPPGGGGVGVSGGAPPLTGGSGGAPALNLPHDFEGQLVHVEFAQDRFVAVGIDTRDGDPLDRPAKAMIVTSVDGRHWTRQAEGQQGFLYSAAFGAGVWVAAGWHIYDVNGDFVYDSTVLVSSDAVTWSEVSWSNADHLDQVVWTGSSFLMKSSNYGAPSLWSSPNGAAWTMETAPEDLNLLAVGSLGVVAGGSTLSFSGDSGQSWSTVLPSPTAWVAGLWADGDSFKGGAYYDCCFGEVPGSEVYYTLDFLDEETWQQSEVPDGTIVPLEVAHGNGVSVGTGYFAELAVRESGSTAWTAVDYPYDTGVDAVAFGANVFVAVGSGLLRYSEDGVTWHGVDSLE